MLSQEDAPLLKAWLVSKAGAVSDAEPDVLADYILALLNNRTEGEELVKLLSEELAVLVNNHESFAKEIVACVDSRTFAKDASVDKIKKDATDNAIELTTRYFKPDLTSYNQAPPDYKRKHRLVTTPHLQKTAAPSVKDGSERQKRQLRQQRVDDLVTLDEVQDATHLIVAQLPTDKLDEMKIRAYFTKFGTISTVTVDSNLRMAEVEFDEPTSARRAWSDAAPIFDNRFVKVFFRKKDAEYPVPELEKPFDIEQFKQRQCEKQRQFEEKRVKKKALDEKLKQLIDLKEKMLANFETQLKSLEEQLIANPECEADIRTRVDQIQNQMFTERITPQDIAEDKSKLEGKSLYALRGRGGALRARGRGGFSPYQRPTSGTYNRKLDLRTRTITIKNLDDPENESFKRALGIFGVEHVLEVAKRDFGVNVTFTDRFYAEKFFHEKIELENMPPLDKEWDESVRSQLDTPTSFTSPQDTEMS
jgi:hypothetical protein